MALSIGISHSDWITVKKIRDVVINGSQQVGVYITSKSYRPEDAQTQYQISFVIFAVPNMPPYETKTFVGSVHNARLTIGRSNNTSCLTILDAGCMLLISLRLEERCLG